MGKFSWKHWAIAQGTLLGTFSIIYVALGSIKRPWLAGMFFIGWPLFAGFLVPWLVRRVNS